MQKEVTLRSLNRAYVKELFASRLFWKGIALYMLGMLVFLSLSITGKYLALAGGILMLIGVFMMMSANWEGHKKVLSHLRWVS
jgi:uncharacterized membrane protein HdeD (DUF308 family)